MTNNSEFYSDDSNDDYAEQAIEKIYEDEEIQNNLRIHYQDRGLALRKIRQSKERINKKVGQVKESQTKVQDCLQIIAKLDNRNKKFLNIDTARVWFYVSVLLGLPVVLILNLILITRPIEYLAMMAFGENPIFTDIAKVVIPLSLLFLELCISANLYHAITRQKKLLIMKWRMAGAFMIAFTPLMILATTWARIQAITMSGESLEGIWPTILINLPLMILAGVTDFVIVFSGEAIHEARGYFWFRFLHSRLESKIRSCRRCFNQAVRVIESEIELCQQIVDGYNLKYSTLQIQVSYNDNLINFVKEHCYTVTLEN